MNQAKVCVIGSMNMDLTVRTRRFPRAGETVVGDHFETFPGGKGANQAVAAARAGAAVSMVGRVGRDEHGKQLRGVLQRERIDVVGVAESWSEPTGVAIVSVDQHGENSVIAVPGANGQLEPGDIHEARSKIASASVMLVQFEVPAPAVLRACQLAKESNTRVILNVAPARALPAELRPLIDVVIVNVHEARALTDHQGTDGTGLEKAVTRLGLPAVVLTRGKAGAVLLGDDLRVFIPVHPVEVVDTFGAGDAFIGAMAAEWAQTSADGTPPSLGDLPGVLRFASAAGSLATTSTGALPSSPRRQDIELLLAQVE